MAGFRQWMTVHPRDLAEAGETFSFSWPTAEELIGFRRALDRHGVLRPLLCRDAPGSRLTVVSGGRRLTWAVESGAVALPTEVLGDCEPEKLWDRLLADAQDHRPLNPVEVGLYLRRRTAHTGETLAMLAEDVLPALGLPARVEAAEDSLWVSGLPADLRHGFADGTRPLHGARLLRRASRQDALTVLRATAGLPGGINKFTELVRTLLECAWRDGVPVATWLTQERLCGPWDRLDSLREQVRERRYPHLRRWEQAFPAAVAAAGLPSRVGIHAPKDFEGCRYQCRLGFTSLDELHEDLLTLVKRLEAGRLTGLEEFLG